MLILPERNAPRGRILMPQRRAEWEESSERRHTFGIRNKTLFHITARHHKHLYDGQHPHGALVWRGWFDDREDADAFFFALITGSLHYERELWRLPTPCWYPDFADPDLVYELTSITRLTSPTGSLQTWTSPTDWNNNNNKIQCLGSGGSGAAKFGTTNEDTGAGGGAYSQITNFVVATPGTTTASYQIGTGGVGLSLSSTTSANGALGGSTWFNNATDPGVGTDNSKCSAAGGDRGQNVNAASGAGGIGGLASASWGQTKFNGGSGGASTSGTSGIATGAGGAAGPSGAGVNGTDGGTAVGTAGGAGDNSTGGSGTAGVNGTGNQVSSNGGTGTEWDTVVGSGGGSGGARSTTGTSVSGSGTGGLYGGGSGAASNSATRTSPGVLSTGNGGQGIIVITYDPLVFVVGSMFIDMPRSRFMKIISY